MSRVLARTFFGSSMRSAASAALNLLATVMVVRWFGSETYAHYIVDLAMISLLLIILEIVPSNYSVFRVQDDPTWQRSICAQIAVTVLIASFFVFAAGHWGLIFKDNSLWMTVYAATMAGKRYLDIRLQSSARMVEFMNIELSTSIARLTLLALCYLQKTDANAAVWGSLAGATLLSQGFWWFQNPSELRSFAGFADRKAWRALSESFPAYLPYYSGIALKRLKDNLAPLVAERLFDSRELLAAFLLAYRGVIFAVGQVRTLEAMMNHRGSLAVAQNMSRQRRYVVAATAQVMCIAASAGLLLSSGLDDLPWYPTLALSFMIWPIVFLVLERAKAYATFQPNRINRAIIAYLIVLLAGTLALKLFCATTVFAFSWVLVVAEAAAYIVIRTISGDRDAKTH
jgi:hypothetical protein